MSGNSSSSSTDIILNLVNGFVYNCLSSRVGNIIFTAFTITSFLLIFPLSVITLYLGQQLWRRKPSTLTSHSDFFTYHMAVMEMIYLSAAVTYCIGVYTDQTPVMVVASYVFYISSCGQMSFHTLTCVERYLAVVFPITYMHISKGSGVKVRNMTILCVWFAFFAKMIVIAVKRLDVVLMLYTMQQAFSLAVMSFCSFAVLRALKRTGPGERGRDRQRVDLSKQRAFNTIMAILGTLLLKFGGGLIYIAISPFVGKNDQCVVLESSYWFRLPSSAVLPLLFLHRVRKLPCCRNEVESERGSSCCGSRIC